LRLSGSRRTTYNTVERTAEQRFQEPAMPDEPISQPAPGSLLTEMVGSKVVIDMRSTYLALGTLIGADELFLALKNADLHDLRDTDTTRENYIAESKATGIKRNRKRVLVLRSDMVAVARLEDVVDE
jgi:small nuclear ribonucleoprotein (snRNP)-like protein